MRCEGSPGERRNVRCLGSPRPHLHRNGPLSPSGRHPDYRTHSRVFASVFVPVRSSHCAPGWIGIPPPRTEDDSSSDSGLRILCAPSLDFDRSQHPGWPRFHLTGFHFSRGVSLPFRPEPEKRLLQSQHSPGQTAKSSNGFFLGSIRTLPRIRPNCRIGLHGRMRSRRLHLAFAPKRPRRPPEQASRVAYCPPFPDSGSPHESGVHPALQNRLLEPQSFHVSRDPSY